MERRTYISIATGTAFAGATGLSGCLESEADGFEIRSVDSEDPGAGDILVLPRVENTASESRSGTVTGEIDFDGSEPLTESTEVTIPGNRTETVEIGIDPSEADTLSPRYEYDAWVESES